MHQMHHSAGFPLLMDRVALKENPDGGRVMDTASVRSGRETNRAYGTHTRLDLT